MSRRGWLLLALLQAAFVGAYLLVEASRGVDERFDVERLDEPAPALRPLRGDVPVAVPDAPHLVHFWATWCAPCVEELPTLLDASEATGVPLVAVTDEPWPVVRRWFEDLGRSVPAPIVRDPDAAALWRVSGLPDTFVVRDGRVVARVGGPRDWSTRAARRQLRAWAAAR